MRGPVLYSHHAYCVWYEIHTRTAPVVTGFWRKSLGMSTLPETSPSRWVAACGLLDFKQPEVLLKRL